MKIQIDTNSKTIKLEQNVKFSEIIETMKKLFPDGEWNEYTLETNSIIYWNSYPQIIYDYNKDWWNQPFYHTGKQYTSNNSGTFNYSNIDGSMIVNQIVGNNDITIREELSTNTNHADGEESQTIFGGIYNVQL